MVMEKLMAFKKYLLCFTLFNFVVANAYAEIYKRVDADGRVTYSNTKTKGAVKLELDPDANTISNDHPKPATTANRRTATPGDFPRVDKDTQNQRDDKRKDILLSELEAEKLALEAAKKAYAEGESNPEVYQKRNANGTTSTFRNVPKFQEKMKNLQAEVDNHQRNVELLQKEIDLLN
jgi:hypothetical protein